MYISQERMSHLYMCSCPSYDLYVLMQSKLGKSLQKAYRTCIPSNFADRAQRTFKKRNSAVQEACLHVHVSTHMAKLREKKYHG